MTLTGVFVPGEGPLQTDLVIVGEAPGEYEEKLKRPFVGPSGKLLMEAFITLGIERKDVYITNVIKYRPTNEVGETITPTTKEIAEVSQEVIREVKAHNPKLVLLLGATATRAFYPKQGVVSKERGIINYHLQGFHTLTTYHPAAILREPKRKPVFISDISLGVNWLKGETKEKVNHKVIRTIEDLEKLEKFLDTQEFFSFDLETSGFNWVEDYVLCISISPCPGLSFVIPFGKEDEFWPGMEQSVVLQCLRRIFESPVKKGAQNGKFDLKFLHHLGIKVNNYCFDTMIEHYLIDENTPHNLDYLANSLLGKPPHDAELRKSLGTNKSYASVPSKILWPYAAYDADYTTRAHLILQEEFKQQPNLWSYYNNTIIPLELALTRMEETGVLVDRKKLYEVKQQLENQIESSKANIFSEIGREINLNSIKQLQELFFSERKHKTLKRTIKGGISVDGEVLKALAKTDNVAKELLSYRENSKLVSTFLAGMLRYIDPTGRIHPNYSLVGTVTGRLSCKEPNLQNIAHLPAIRGIFVAPPGYVFIGVDYKQIELLVVAILAGEDKLVVAYDNGVDLHRAIGAEVLHKAPEEITDDERYNFKTINFGILYGMGVGHLARELGIEKEQAEEEIRKYFATFPKIRQLRNKIFKDISTLGYVENPFGLRRHLVIPDGCNEATRAEILRQGFNAPTQGGAAQITNRALVSLFEAYDNHHVLSLPIKTLHDALYFYCPQDSWMKDVGRIQKIMERPVKELGGISPRVDIEVGTCWGDSSLRGKK